MRKPLAALVPFLALMLPACISVIIGPPRPPSPSPSSPPPTSSPTPVGPPATPTPEPTSTPTPTPSASATPAPTPSAEPSPEATPCPPVAPGPVATPAPARDPNKNPCDLKPAKVYTDKGCYVGYRAAFDDEMQATDRTWGSAKVPEGTVFFRDYEGPGWIFAVLCRSNSPFDRCEQRFAGDGVPAGRPVEERIFGGEADPRIGRLGRVCSRAYLESLCPPVPPAAPPSPCAPPPDPGPPPSPPPGGGIEDDPKWCVVDPATGQFPLPVYDPNLNGGGQSAVVAGNVFCPSCWRAAKYADLFLKHWGIAPSSRIKVSRPKPEYLNYRQNLHLTPHSETPFLPHRWNPITRRVEGSEMYGACQPDIMSEDVPNAGVDPPPDDAPGNEPGVCEHQSENRYHVHHKPKAHQAGLTRFWVMHPKGKSIVLDLPEAIE